jgi:hypothetical protein
MTGAPDPRRKRLGDLLLEEGLIDRFQLQAALAEQKKWGGRLGRHLIELGILSEEVLVKVLSKLLALPSVDVGRLSMAASVIQYVPAKTAEKFHVIPIGVEESPAGKRTIIVAMSDPTNLAALDELRFTTGCAVRPVVSGDSSIERAIRTYYHAGEAVPQQGHRAKSPAYSQVEPAPEMVIMRGGEPQRIQMDLTDVGGAPAKGGGVLPEAPPEMMSSLPAGALTPAPAPDSPEENAKRVNALLRVLIKRKVLTEDEFLAELLKG